mmetsp:Transcript_158449/g.508270  ORF Transcript_158449/g.508270 Transcript_158449/m.508270 type:complete len:334 (-) Transcript_158449:93-1094(-)
MPGLFAGADCGIACRLVCLNRVSDRTVQQLDSHRPLCGLLARARGRVVCDDAGRDARHGHLPQQRERAVPAVAGAACVDGYAESEDVGQHLCLPGLLQQRQCRRPLRASLTCAHRRIEAHHIRAQLGGRRRRNGGSLGLGLCLSGIGEAAALPELFEKGHGGSPLVALFARADRRVECRGRGRRLLPPGGGSERGAEEVDRKAPLLALLTCADRGVARDLPRADPLGRQLTQQRQSARPVAAPLASADQGAVRYNVGLQTCSLHVFENFQSPRPPAAALPSCHGSTASHDVRRNSDARHGGQNGQRVRPLLSSCTSRGEGAVHDDVRVAGSAA